MEAAKALFDKLNKKKKKNEREKSK